MPRLYMMKGLPGSGKTTHVRKYMKGIKRISKDDLRDMVDGGVYSPENETTIIGMRDQMAMFLLVRGHDVVIDDCNLNPDHEKALRAVIDYIPLKQEDEFTLVVVDIYSNLQDCIDRDKGRKYSVGEEAIRKMDAKYPGWSV